MSRLSFSRTTPSWLEPPPTEEGSLDPLGFLAPAESIAEQILPGVTVATRRARYLSFLCWAIRETAGSPVEIDRWEVALSVGEYLRHSSDQIECVYLGRRLVTRGQFEAGETLPRRLHIQTARRLYSGLLRSMDLTDARGQLTGAGERVADEIARDMPRRIPQRIYQCNAMPCLSHMRTKERRWLRQSLLSSNQAGEARRETVRTVGRFGWRAVVAGDVAQVLNGFLARKNSSGANCARSLHSAAKLELQAMPLTRLFMHLYRNEGRIGTRASRNGALRVYRVRNEPPKMLSDVIAHLRKARTLGEDNWPLQPESIFRRLLDRHRVDAKPEAPWVDASWKALRLGLGSQRDQKVHAYRLPAFSSLLRDLGEIS